MLNFPLTRNKMLVQLEATRSHYLGLYERGVLNADLTIGGLGGVLFGAAAGARREDQSTAIITLEYDDQLLPLYVRCTSADYEKLSNLGY